jgi:uncharacterized membrane protein YdbT with pleckstrin-like domain
MIGRVAFPSRLLNDGEHVVVHTRTHAKAMLVPALLLIVIAFGTGLLYSMLPDQGSARLLVQAVFWGVAALLIVVWVGKPFARWMTTTYTFTNRRFISRSGFVAKKGRTIPLNRISGVDYDIGVVDRVFGCGTLVVTDASESGSVLLHDIPHVERVQLQVSEELHRLSAGGRERADDGT